MGQAALGMAARRQTRDAGRRGIALSKQYAEQDLDMMFEHAQFEDGSVSVEAGLWTC